MERPIKVGLVSPYDLAFHGGVNDHINKLGAQFRAWGHTVKVIAPCSAPQRISDPDFIPMGRPVPLPSGGSIARISLSVWLLPRIKAMLQREAFDVIHLHEPFAGFVSLWTIRASDSINIGTFHTFRGHKLYNVGFKRLAKPYFAKLHGRIAVSKPASDFISRHFPGDYALIPNGIQVDDFGPSVEPFPHLRDGKTNLLFVGRLEKRKGLKYLLGAYSQLKWKWPNLRLVVVGSGTPDADSYRIMSERNLQDVIFAGSVSEADKIRFFKSADIFCSPATGKESFGMVLLEAMAADKPVVATAIEGYSSVVTHDHDGLLVPPKDDEALADAIGTLLESPELRAKLISNGRRTVQEFRWERVAGRVMDYYWNYLETKQAVLAR